MTLAAGTRLGPYEIQQQIGEGGMGSVYRALDTRLNRLVAIKMVAAHAGERFRQEALAIAAYRGPAGLIHYHASQGRLDDALASAMDAIDQRFIFVIPLVIRPMHWRLASSPRWPAFLERARLGSEPTG